MTLYDLKPRFQSLLRPILTWLHDTGVTANQVTIATLIASVLIGFLLICIPNPALFIILPLFLFVRMALNAIDGLLARDYHQQTKLGAVLNETGDIISDAALYLPFALLPNAQPLLVFLVILLAALTEFCGVVAQTIGAERRYDGPLGKSDRAFLFGVYGLAIAIWPLALTFSQLIFSIAGLLLIWTCFNRCRRALIQADKPLEKE